MILQAQVICQYCGRAAKFKKGTDVFPDRPDLAHANFWVCTPCKARVGCHEGTDKPLGSLANGKLRAVRRMGHEAFDPIWKFMVNLKGGKPQAMREAMYEWLSKDLGIPQEECHFGGMPYELCLLATKRCIELRRDLEQRYGKSISNVPLAISIPPDLDEDVPF